MWRTGLEKGVPCNLGNGPVNDLATSKEQKGTTSSTLAFPIKEVGNRTGEGRAHANKTHFHKSGFSLSLVFKGRDSLELGNRLFNQTYFEINMHT